MAKETPRSVVLVADDEEEMRVLIARYVESQGHKVLSAADGAEAWELAQKHRPDLVLLDVRMPEMSGWQVCRNITHSPDLKGTKIIMITGIGETINDMTSPLMGAFAHLDKPFELDDLESKMKAALASSSAPDSAPRAPAKKAASKKAAPKKAPAKKAAKKAPAKKAVKKVVPVKKGKAPAAKKAAKAPARKAAPAKKKAAPAKKAAKKAVKKPAKKKG